jgi:hypothetical protein
VVTRKDHIRHLGGDIDDPLLPEIPVGFVEDTHIAAQRATLVRDLSSGDRPAARELTGGAVVADGPVVCAMKDTRVPVVRVTMSPPCQAKATPSLTACISCW